MAGVVPPLEAMGAEPVTSVTVPALLVNPLGFDAGYAPNAVKASGAVVDPVPPLATASVPPRVNVPDAVIGPPVKLKPVVPPEPSTLVTVPTPATDVQVGAEPPLDVNT